MKTDKINLFNSVFEMKLRIILLLSIDSDQIYSTDRILALDFISCYAKIFGYPFNNLHGDNQLMFAELANRRSLICESLKKLVVEGLVEAIVDKGFFYKISAVGEDYISKFESNYFKEYLGISKEVTEKCINLSDEDLLKIIQTKSLYSNNGGV